MDIFTINSLGFIIIRSFTRQLNGELEVLTTVPGFGIKLTIHEEVG
ncbi:MAG: hypothetical protein PHC65_04175 [Methanobacteriaceae archaeon]|nr:hypothetical protein [Methanobacteriaceae archaeon]MDD3409158.1 hypothetical protein [Methanobacteriaceae archaeon]MDD4594134.1 hypothetical protein [Methanobacteriaceae archaeon]